MQWFAPYQVEMRELNGGHKLNERIKGSDSVESTEPPRRPPPSPPTLTIAATACLRVRSMLHACRTVHRLRRRVACLSHVACCTLHFSCMLQVACLLAELILESQTLQFLYSDGDMHYFMNPESYESVSLYRIASFTRA